jgi:hypothetical protein
MEEYLNVNGIIRYAYWTTENKGCDKINVIGNPETALGNLLGKRIYRVAVSLSATMIA